MEAEASRPNDLQDSGELRVPVAAQRLVERLGALIGGGASLWPPPSYTQRCQDRLQRIASEVTKREAAYADFVMSASNLLLDAFIHDEISPNVDEQRLIGLINRMRLFAQLNVVGGAEAVFRAIVEIALKPRIELRQLAKEALSKSPVLDPILASARSVGLISTACREARCEASASGPRPTCVGQRRI